MENINLNQFILKVDNAFSNELCDQIISIFENSVSNNNIVQNLNNLNRKDTSIFLQSIDSNLTPTINKILNNFFSIYANEYGQLKESSKITFDIKVQKTLPKEGYHLWHYENTNWLNSYREVVWMVYLNDVKEGGETEFLYQSIRFKPKKGTLLMWPASYTHVHRGNPPISGEKYIATGWYIRIP